MRSTPQARKPWEVMGKQVAAASRRLTSRAAADAVRTRNARGAGRARTIQVAELSLEVEDAVAVRQRRHGARQRGRLYQYSGAASAWLSKRTVRLLVARLSLRLDAILWKGEERCLLDCVQTEVTSREAGHGAGHCTTV